MTAPASQVSPASRASRAPQAPQTAVRTVDPATKAPASAPAESAERTVSPATKAPAGAQTAWEIVNPAALGAPRGWNNGMLAPAEGRVLFVAGQIGAGPEGGIAHGLAQQFGAALANVARVVEQAGGRVADVGRLSIFVTDMPTYRASLSEVGAEYRAVFGKHFPAMSLVEVSALVHPEALVEVEATAVLPS